MPVAADHFLLTRFNVRMKSDGDRPSDEWLRHRLDLFARICMLSVKSQSCQNFRWLVFLDARCPEWFREQISALADGCFSAVWITTEFTAEVPSTEVARRARRSHVITSRLDNDDAIARTYIARVQECFSAQRFEFINFTTGLQLEGGRLYRRSDPSNAFVSLIEQPSGRPRTIYLDQHDRLSRHGRVRQVKTNAMWLQVVHGRNVANSARGIPTAPKRIEAHFTVNITLESVSRVRLMFDQLSSALGLAVRIVASPRRLIWLWRVVRPVSRRHP